MAKVKVFFGQRPSSTTPPVYQIYIGNTRVSKLYVGATEITTAYVGATILKS